MKNIGLIIGGVVVLGGLAYYFYTKKQGQSMLPGILPAPSPSTPSVSPGGSVVFPSPSTPSPSYTAPVPVVKQTMWKDKDGNVFQLTSDHGQWGFYIKVNGTIAAKWNMMETMFLGSDGYVRGVDNNGSSFIYKDRQWNYVIKDNKTASSQFLIDNGQPNVYLTLKGLGLGNAFVLN